MVTSIVTPGVCDIQIYFPQVLHWFLNMVTSIVTPGVWVVQIYFPQVLHWFVNERENPQLVQLLYRSS